jgi:hypothetical protein
VKLLRHSQKDFARPLPHIHRGASHSIPTSSKSTANLHTASQDPLSAV